MARLIRFEGRTISVPDDATDAEVAEILEGSTPPAAAPTADPAAMAAATPSDLPVPGTLRADGSAVPTTEQAVNAPKAPTTPYDRYRSSDNLIDSIMAVGDYALNNAPVLTNLLPGADGVQPMSPNPIGGSESLNQVRKGFGVIPDAPYDRYRSSDNLIDSIMAVGDYALTTGAIFSDRAGEGAANLAGLPVDIINNAPVLANLLPGVDGVQPMSPNPIGGSESLNQLRKGFGVIPDAPEPTDILQTIVGRVGEEVGAGIVPAGAIIGKAGRMGVDAVRGSGPLSRFLLEKAAADPAKFLGGEVGGAVAAGTGAGLANQVVDRDTTGGQAADLAGAIGGVGATGLAKIVGGALFNAGSAISGSKRYADQVVKDAVADRLLRAAGVEGTELTRGAPDAQQLVDAIMSGRGPDSPSAVVPGFKESIADRTGNSGLASFEYSRQPGENAGVFATRRHDNAKAVDEALGLLQPTQTPGAFRQELSATRDMRLSAAADEKATAQSEFDRFIQTLVPQVDAEGRGAAIRGGVSDARRAVTETEDQVWRAISGEVDPAPLANTLDETRAGLTEARRMSVADMDPVVDIPRRLSELGDVPGGEVAPPTLVDLQELVDQRSSLLTDQRNAASIGNTNRAEALGRYIDRINAFMDSDAVPAETRAQLDLARSVSRNANDRFNRPNDPIADILATREGNPNVPDSAVGGKFVRPDEGQASNIDRLLAETDLTSRAVEVRSALKDEILAGIDKKAMAGDSARLDQYLNQYSRVFDRFPDLREEVAAAADAGRSFKRAGDAETALQRELGTPDGSVKGKGPVGSYLEFSDANSERAINEILTAKDPGAAADELLNFIGDDPAAVEGARAAFWEKMRTKGQSNDNTQRTPDGTRAWRGDWLKNFLDEPATRAVAERLYRDNPEHLADVQRIADVLDNVDLRQRGKAPGTSGTAQGFNPLLSVETLQSRGYAYMRGQIGGAYLLTSFAAVIARRAVSKAQKEAIDRIIDEALLEPDFAAMLLKENNPANRKALARKGKLWMGNQASTIVNLLDGDDEPEGGQDGNQ